MEVKSHAGFRPLDPASELGAGFAVSPASQCQPLRAAAGATGSSGMLTPAMVCQQSGPQDCRGAAQAQDSAQRPMAPLVAQRLSSQASLQTWQRHRVLQEHASGTTSFLDSPLEARGAAVAASIPNDYLPGPPPCHSSSNYQHSLAATPSFPVMHPRLVCTLRALVCDTQRHAHTDALRDQVDLGGMGSEEQAGQGGASLPSTPVKNGSSRVPGEQVGGMSNWSPVLCKSSSAGCHSNPAAAQHNRGSFGSFESAQRVTRQPVTHQGQGRRKTREGGQASRRLSQQMPQDGGKEVSCGSSSSSSRVCTSASGWTDRRASPIRSQDEHGGTVLAQKSTLREEDWREHSSSRTSATAWALTPLEALASSGTSHLPLTQGTWEAHVAGFRHRPGSAASTLPSGAGALETVEQQASGMAGGSVRRAAPGAGDRSDRLPSLSPLSSATGLAVLSTPGSHVLLPSPPLSPASLGRPALPGPVRRAGSSGDRGRSHCTNPPQGHVEARQGLKTISTSTIFHPLTQEVTGVPALPHAHSRSTSPLTKTQSWPQGQDAGTPGGAWGCRSQDVALGRRSKKIKVEAVNAGQRSAVRSLMGEQGHFSLPRQPTDGVAGGRKGVLVQGFAEVARADGQVDTDRQHQGQRQLDASGGHGKMRVQLAGSRHGQAAGGGAGHPRDQSEVQGRPGSAAFRQGGHACGSELRCSLASEEAGHRSNAGSGHLQGGTPPQKKSHTLCPECGRSFVGMYELRRHFGRKHMQGEKPFSCGKCSKRFFVEADAKEHERNCGMVLTCDSCGLKFAFKCNLTHHIKGKDACRDFYDERGKQALLDDDLSRSAPSTPSAPPTLRKQEHFTSSPQERSHTRGEGAEEVQRTASPGSLGASALLHHGRYYPSQPREDTLWALADAAMANTHNTWPQGSSSMWSLGTPMRLAHQSTPHTPVPLSNPHSGWQEQHHPLWSPWLMTPSPGPALPPLHDAQSPCGSPLNLNVKQKLMPPSPFLAVSRDTTSPLPLRASVLPWNGSGLRSNDSSMPGLPNCPH